MDYLIVATTLGIVAAVWGTVLVVLIASRAVGRLRLQRQTEARLRAYQEEHSGPTVMGRWFPKSERPPFTGPEENGVTSSEHTRGTPPTPRRS